MAEHVLETRLLLRYDTYSNWMNSNLILKVGEAAVAAFPQARSILTSNIMPENTPPALGIKIGDGTHYFRELPWIQAVAADVYNWAKSASKPTYTASEIQGLRTFIEESIGGQGGDISIAPRIYQIVEGTNENAHKFYLQYKEDEGNNWTVDINHPIDLNDLYTLISWINSENLTRYANLTSLTGFQTLSILGSLEYTDTVQNNLFVTAVNETAGKITVSKARPNFTNITGTATVEQGGTGLSSVSPNEVLVGTGANILSTRQIATEISDNNYLVPNYLIKSYVDQSVAGLTGAMHFIGEAGVTITPNSNVDPRIADYDFSKARAGDVILFELKEYVWTGGAWRLLGDEGSYAVKGSIKDIDIAADAAIQQTKIQGLSASFASKVDKVEGKDLSTNDFSNDYKIKLDLIESGAQRNVIEHIFLNGNETLPGIFENKANSINLIVSEFDAESRLKLAGIAEHAQVNTIERITLDGVEVTPNENKVVNLVSDPHTDHINKIERIFLNNVEQFPRQGTKDLYLVIDPAALQLNVLEGARVPSTTVGQYEDVNITSTGAKKLELARIAKTGNIKDIIQSDDEYVLLDCGTSTSDTH